MDVERTVEFILEQQAQTAAQLGQLIAHQAKTDRQLSAIQTLLRTGIKMMIQRDKATDARFKATDARFKATDARISALAEAQQRTERKLERLIQALLGKGGNGR